MFPLVLLQVKAVGKMGTGEEIFNVELQFPLVLLQVKAVGFK